MWSMRYGLRRLYQPTPASTCCRTRFFEFFNWQAHVRYPRDGVSVKPGTPRNTPEHPRNTPGTARNNPGTPLEHPIIPRNTLKTVRHTPGTLK